MEKVNEVGRFKQRAVNNMYSSGYQCFDLNLNLELLHSYRFNYKINEDNLTILLNYIGYLSIPELGIKNCKTRITKYGEELRHVYLTLTGKKKDIDNVNMILKRLCVELKE